MVFEVKLSPSGICFDVAEGSTILDAALSVNKNISYSCKNGSCGTCKSKILSGKVAQVNGNAGISDEEIAQGYILTCAATLESDAVIELDYLAELDGIKELILPCKVEDIDFYSDDIMTLKLKLPPASELKYLSGQYVDLIYKSIRRSYSIANVFLNNKMIELHIRRVKGGEFTSMLFDDLKVGALLRLSGPYGTFFVRDSKAPIIFLAGGTGFAPIKAMVEDLLYQNIKREINIYWGVQKVDQFYSDFPLVWSSENTHIKFVSVVSGKDEVWNGVKSLVHEAVLNDFTSLDEFHVYACGSSAMIDVAKQSFINKGMDVNQFFADAFTPMT